MDIFSSNKNSDYKKTGFFRSMRINRFFRLLCCMVLFFFVQEIITIELARIKVAYAQPSPPYVLPVSPKVVLTPSTPFQNPILRGVRINPENPLEFDFLLDLVNEDEMQEEQVSTLIKYFLAGVTIPDEELWVNLNPQEPEKIMPDSLAHTVLGRELLLQDYVLKQFSASLTFPDSDIGQKFWERCNRKIKDKYGAARIPVNTFFKVWIVPKNAVVYEKGAAAFITESKLDVLLEDEYMTQKQGVKGFVDKSQSNGSFEDDISAEIAREIILPEILKEVNEGEHFSSLRQVFNSLILAAWFKSRMKKHLVFSHFVDQKKIKGIDENEIQTNEEIFESYIESLHQGVYDFIREDYDFVLQDIVPRRYFSGGFSYGQVSNWLSIRPLTDNRYSIFDYIEKLKQRLRSIKVRLGALGKNGVISSDLFAAEKIKRARRSMLLALPILLAAFFSNPAQAQDNSISAPAVAVESQYTYHIGDPLMEKSENALERLKEFVSLEDVLSLDGKKNPHTKKAYKIDEAYFKANWDRVFEAKKYGWAQQVIVIAAQHKLNAALEGRKFTEDGVLRSQTMSGIENYQGVSQASEETAPKVETDKPLARESTESFAGLSTLNLGEPIESIDKPFFAKLKELVTMDDVAGLNGKINALTGKAFKVDENYFKANWDTVFESKQYLWPQETLVIAFQKKYGLKADGDLGKATRKSIHEEHAYLVERAAVKKDDGRQINVDVAEEYSSQEAAEVKDDGTVERRTDQPAAEDDGRQIDVDVAEEYPPREAAEVKDDGTVERRTDQPTAQDDGRQIDVDLALEYPPEEEPAAVTEKEDHPIIKFYNAVKIPLLSLLSFFVIAFTVVRNRITRHASTFDKDLFLMDITAYLKGKKNQPFRLKDKKSLIPRKAVLEHMTVQSHGGRLEVILRSATTIKDTDEDDNKKILARLESLFANDDILAHVRDDKPIYLKFAGARLRTTHIKLSFTMPVKHTYRLRSGEPIFISARKEYKSNEYKTFSVPIDNNAENELLDLWEASLENGNFYRSEHDLQSDIIRHMDQERQAERDLEGLIEKSEALNQQLKDSRYASFSVMFQCANSVCTEEEDMRLKEQTFKLESDAAEYRRQLLLTDAQITTAQRNLDRMRQKIDLLNRLTSLEGLVESIQKYTKENPFGFRGFRGHPAVINYQLRVLVERTLMKLTEDPYIPSEYSNYFYYLADYYDTTRALMGHSGTLDGNKAQFFPSGDILQVTVLGVPLDKLIRVITLQEFYYRRVKVKIKEGIESLYQITRKLNKIEGEILEHDHDKENDDVNQKHGVEELTRKFNEFNSAFEQPYADSIIGADLYRRRLWFISSAQQIMLFTVFAFTFYSLGWFTQAYIPLIGLGIYFFYFNVYLPGSFIKKTQQAYDVSRAAARNIYQPQDEEEYFDSTLSVKGEALKKLSQRYIPSKNGFFSRFVLRAQEFYDFGAVNYNDHIELRMNIDSYLPKGNKIAGKMLKDISLSYDDEGFENTIRLYYVIGQKKVRVPLEDIAVTKHSRGMRINLQNPPDGVEDIAIQLAGGVDENDASVVLVKVAMDQFQSLINKWQLFISQFADDDSQEPAYDQLVELMTDIRAFRSPHELSFSDFRQHAGYYNVIRDLSFDTYSLMIQSENEHLRKYADYFLTLAGYSNSIRSAMGSFAGMDALKSEYLPATNKFLRKVFGISVATVLRNIFGVSFLYDLARTNVLASIKEITSYSHQLDMLESTVFDVVVSAKNINALEVELKRKLEKADISFRYPEYKSLVEGRDLNARDANMWLKVLYSSLIVISVVTILVPANLVTQVLGISLLSMWYLVLLSWMSPYTAQIQTNQETNEYKQYMTKFYKMKDMQSQQINELDTDRKKFSKRGRKLSNLSVLISAVFLPILIPFIFLNQEIKKMKINRTLKKDRIFDTDFLIETAPLRGDKGMLADQPPGGIDLGSIKKDLTINKDLSDSVSLPNVTDESISDLQGFSFRIIQFNPPMNFMKFFGSISP